MRIKANKAELLAAVKQVLPCVERKTTIPILANVLFKAELDTLSITGTDLDTALTVTRSCKVMTEGAITIPARKLADTLGKLKTLPDAEVEISSNANYWVTLACGQLSVKLIGMNVLNYPSLAKWPADKPSVALRGETLSGLISRTRYAIASKESRYTLNGALLSIQPNLVRMVATDGHRLALAEHIGEFPATLRMLIPKGGIDILSGLTQGELTISHDDSHFFAKGEGWQFTSRLLTGQFPNYEAVLPENTMQTITVQGKTLAASLARVAAFSNERSHATRFELVPGKGLRLSASSTETGEASETVATGYESHACYVGFDSSYVADVLGSLDKDQDVVLSIRDQESPAMFSPVEANGFSTKSVLMPLRLS